MVKQLVAAVVCAAFGVSALAQVDPHGHGDILGTVVGSQIIVAGGEAVFSGGLIFEGDFGDEHEGPNGTDAPGFDIGGFRAGNEALAFNVEGPLQFWNGSSWGLAPIAGLNPATITLEGAFGNSFTIDGSSSGQTGLVAVGTSGTGGEGPDVVHSHIDFVINPNAAFGAYLFQISLFGYGWETNPSTLESQLTNQLYDADVPVYIALNYSDEFFTDEQFEAAVAAFANPVPVPAAWLFMASGLGALLLGRRFKS